MTTVKNVGLSPINRGDVKKYTAMQSPSFREDFWDKMNSTNDADYYMYVLNEADKKGLKLEDIDFNGLDNLDDQWAAFYMEAAADNITKKDYGEIDGEAWGELTEKEYLGKILNKKKEYNAWVRQEAEIAAQKEAMSGWDKFWNGVGSFFVELGYGLETIPLALVDFVTNWDGGESLGVIEDWRLNLEERQANLADYERKYTYLRNVDDWDTTFLGDLTIGAAQTLSLMIPAAISNYLLPGSGMYVMYGASFLENVYEARHNPDVSATQVEIILRAALMTGAEVAIEKLMGASLLDNVVLNGRKFSTELGKVSAKEGLKILGKEIVHEAAEEALQELSSGLTNMVLSLGNTSFEQYNSKNLAADIGMAALMGAIFAAGNVINGQVIKDIATGRFIRTLTGKYKGGDVISNKNLISEPKKKTTQDDEKKGSIKDVTKKQKDPNGFHATNFFERIALSANMRTFQENLELAKKGKLSKDEQQLLYNQTMALGQIFGMTSEAQLKSSMDLLEKLQEYAKVEGAKQEIIDQTDNLYIQSLVTNLSAIQSEAAKTFYGKKISEKEAAKLAKEARISKTKKVIDKKNVEEEVKKVEAKEKDTKKVARKKAIKTLVEEGKTILTTDGNDIEVLEDNILIPDKYLEDGDPAHAVRSALEKDIAQEFVTFMKNPKRLVGWSKAKAALIKAYPEMKDFTDQQIARNLLFNPNGAHALITTLPNSEFNILSLNLLEGIKQVVYKTKVAQAVKNECIKILENNFRFAARAFCSENLGVNPHDLHNVLTKEDQIYIKNERAKIEAKVSEVARSKKKTSSKQQFVLDNSNYYAFKDKKGRSIYVNSDEDLEAPGHVTFFISDEETLLGRWYLDLAPNNQASVEHLVLPPDYQRSGIGSQVLNLMEEYAKQNWGVNEVVVAVGSPSNLTREEATEFYKSQGYSYNPDYRVPKAGEGGKTRLIKSLVGSKQEFQYFENTQEGASLTTPEYENETYQRFQKGMLNKKLTPIEKASTTLKDMVTDPETYLSEEVVNDIKEEFGDLSKASVYMYLRSLVIEVTNGKKSLTVSENGDKYYFADVTPVKNLNTTKVTSEVEADPEGRSLFDKYEGKTVKATEFWKGEALIGKAGDVEIEFTKTGGTYYSEEQNKIYFNIKSKMFKTNSDLLFGINHEFQHALQSTNRTNRGFALGLDIPKELVEEVKKLYPDSFKNIKTPEGEKKRANEIIYQYSGEEEAFQHATDIDFYPFVVAIKGANYVIFTPNGNKPYQVPFARTNKLDEEKVNTEAIPKAPRVPSKKLRDETNLKFFKKKNKKLRMDPDLQYFVITADLSKLDEWIVERISGSKKGTLTKRKLMRWFKETQDMNEYTFKLLKEAFWEDSPILTFQQLCEIGLSLTQEFDENGNLKQVYFRNSDGKEFVISEGKYRVAIMQHWNSDEDISKLRKIVGFTETQRNQEINFSTLERKAQTSTDDDTIELNLGSEDDAFEAILQDSYTQKAERLYATYRQELGAKVIRGDLSKEEARAKIKKFGLNYWENLPKEKLDELYLKLMLKKHGIKRNAETITRAVKRNRTHARTRLKNLGTRIWNAVAPKNRNRLPKEVLDLYDKDGKIRQDVYKGKSIDEVVRVENLLAETWKKAKRGDYNSKEVEKAYADLEKAKSKLEKMKSKTQTKIKNQNKTATEYVTQIKTKAKVISVESTKKKVPSKLEKLFATNFTKKRISNMQELENFEYFVSEGELFRGDNQEILDSITEAEWIEIIEWFEQSEFVGTEKDLGVFKAIRMFVLADFISKIRTHQLVLNQTWVNRANNIMSSKVHSSAVEMATFGKVLNTINPFRKTSEEFNVSEELLDRVNEAWDSDNEEELAKAIDELKEEIAANYVEKNMMEKILAFRYTSMLSGPVTWLRNLLSNYVVKYFNKWSAGIGEFLTKHTFMGKRVRNHEGYILVGTKVTSEVANFIKEELLDNGLLAQLTEGYSKYDPYAAETTKDIDKDYIVRTLVNNWNKKFEQEHVYGDGPMGQMFSKFSSFVRKMISDDKFVNEATLRYFGKMLTEDLEAGRLSPEELKQGIFNSKKIISIFAEAQWLAMNDYMKNANFMTKAMSALNENPWARYIMPLIIPFAQSSWNWWVETVRYSPLSWVSIIPRLIKFDKYVNKMEAKRKSSKKGQSASVQGSMLDRFMVTRDLGKGVIGTSLWTLGIIMAATGVVGLAKDEEDKYVIKMWNAEIDVSNFFGSSSFLAGAALVGAIKDGRWAEMFSVTIDQMARTLFITDMLSTFRFQTVGDYVMELPMNILYSFIPNFIKMLSNNLQVYKVKYDAGILGDLERIATGLIPGLSYAFDVERDPFTGKKRFHKIPILTQALGISYNDVSEVERAAIAVGVGAGQLTGEITVDGEKVKIDADKANQYRGEIANYYLTQLLEDSYIHNDKRYSQMNQEERKAAIKSIMSKASDYAKIKVWTESGNKYYASSELYYTLKSLGIQNVYQGKGGYIKK